MRIDHVSEPFRAQLAKKVDAGQKKGAAQKSKKTDNVNVSSDGKALSDTQASVEAAKAQVTNAPDVRAERVEEVKQRIKDGYYNSPQFADRLADKLIKDIGKDLGIT